MRGLKMLECTFEPINFVLSSMDFCVFVRFDFARLTGREYAITGQRDGTSFVDISDPYNPVVLAFVPSHLEVYLNQSWRDIKVSSSYVESCSFHKYIQTCNNRMVLSCATIVRRIHVRINSGLYNPWSLRNFCKRFEVFAKVCPIFESRKMHVDTHKMIRSYSRSYFLKSVRIVFG